ncbi:hypothetical protein E6R60_26275 [Streptomyces sp. A0642]|uniref:hypothetical protein n=1 Tax=Streptomyces sp. A0642 TaxID=2563100 RepID=UPI0010A24ADB|nr:hypothetical protein [Streptomyces sp. A0642]THA72443.1 hypothetical protein E6R60_26275 [Streptomyces sp. A0642]
MTMDFGKLSSDSLPMAWQATADNQVDRQYPSVRSSDEEKLASVRERVRTARTVLNGLVTAVDEVSKVLQAPEAELATARQALIDLQRRNDALILEARRQKQRATEAEKVQTRLVAGQKPVEALRYSKRKLLGLTNSDGEIGGIAMLIGMVADDLERLESDPGPDRSTEAV